MDVVVRTGAGAVRGEERDGVASFKGIPYAAAPYGANRFRAPVRPERWDGVRDALSFGPTAPHPPYPSPMDQLLPDPLIPGDDCLNLNVWSPDVTGSGLPVMVWIHGGAFVNGSSAVPSYVGDGFARDGVVCVTINYRIGCDGFLYLRDAPANRGLLDQIAALEWVQEHIAAFGGDPGNVTVFGESAGAMSVTSLLSMPATSGLFRRAIAQSGAGHHVLSTNTAQLVTDEVARRLGVEATAAGFASVDVARLVETQAALSLDIATSRDRTVWREIAGDSMPFEPTVDGDVLAARPFDAIAAGAGAGVDLLIGTNQDEFRLFLVPNGVLGYVDEATVEGAATTLGLDAEGYAAYRSAAATPGEALASVLGDWFFRIPALRLAEHRDDPTYVYEFAWRSPLFDGALGACHALEIDFVFDTLDEEGAGILSGEDPPRELATEMHAAWVQFARTGELGWERYDDAARTTMTFDATSGVVKDPRPEQRSAWIGIR